MQSKVSCGVANSSQHNCSQLKNSICTVTSKLFKLQLILEVSDSAIWNTQLAFQNINLYLGTENSSLKLIPSSVIFLKECCTLRGRCSLHPFWTKPRNVSITGIKWMLPVVCQLCWHTMDSTVPFPLNLFWIRQNNNDSLLCSEIKINK